MRSESVGALIVLKFLRLQIEGRTYRLFWETSVIGRHATRQRGPGYCTASRHLFGFDFHNYFDILMMCLGGSGFGFSSQNFWYSLITCTWQVVPWRSHMLLVLLTSNIHFVRVRSEMCLQKNPTGSIIYAEFDNDVILFVIRRTLCIFDNPFGI